MTGKLTEEELEERDDQARNNAYDEPDPEAEEPDLTDEEPKDPPLDGPYDIVGHREFIPDEDDDEPSA